MDCYLSTIASIERTLSNLLVSLAIACARNPVKTIGIFLGVFAICFAGISQIIVENRASEIWADQNSIPAKDAEYVLDVYQEESEFSSYIVKSKNDAPGVNVLTKAIFDDVFALHDSIVLTEASPSVLTYDDLCIRAPSGLCFTFGALQFWNFNSTLYADTVFNDDDVQMACAQEFFPGEML